MSLSTMILVCCDGREMELVKEVDDTKYYQCQNCGFKARVYDVTPKGGEKYESQ